MASSGLRHIAQVFGPPTQVGESGQLVGPPVCVAEDVPIEVKALSGRELEQAQLQVANATFKVVMRPLSDKPLTPENWLVLDNGQRLNVGFIDTYSMPGVTWFLTCGSEVDEGDADGN